jgi:hypothetical protein
MTTESWDNLPPEVEAIKGEIEQRSGEEVWFTPSDDISGAMTAKWIGGNEPVVFFKEYSHAGAAEELLHLILDLDGCFRMQIPNGGQLITSAAIVLHNLLQHAVIFPRLETMDYSQDKGECESTLKLLSSLIEKYQSLQEVTLKPGGTSLLAALYVRAKRHCTSATFESGLEPDFQQTGFLETLELGEELDQAIQLAANSSAEQYNAVLEKCVGILGLARHVVFKDAREEE